jgi:hypothetical protein
MRPGEGPVESMAVSFLASRLRTSPEHLGMESVPPDTESSVNLALAALVDIVVLRLVQVGFVDIAVLVHIVVAAIGDHGDAFP